MSGLRWLRTARDRRAVGRVLRSASATLAVGVVALYGLALTFYSGSANPLSTKCPHGAMGVEVVRGWINPALLITTVVATVAALIVRRAPVNGRQGI